MRSLRLVPYWSVHETLGVDAHNAPLKMRTRRIHLSRAVAWSCVRRHPVAGAALGSTDVEGSDPPGRGPGAGAGPGVFSHAGPRPPRGRSRSNYPVRTAARRDPPGRGGFWPPPSALPIQLSRRFSGFEVAEHLVIGGPSVRLLGIAVKDQDPDGRGPQPRLQDRDAPVPSLAAAFLQRTDGPVATRRGGRHGCLMPNLPDAATVTAASSGAPRLLRWPWRNRNAASDMQNRGRVHWKGDSVSPHPRCRMGTCGTAPAPAESVFKIHFGEPLATPCLPMPSTVTRGLRTGTLSPTRATATDQQIACTDLPSKAQAPAEAATGGEPPSARTFFRADRAVHHRGGIE